MRTTTRIVVLALLAATVTVLAAPAFAQYGGYEVYERREYYPRGPYPYDNGYDRYDDDYGHSYGSYYHDDDYYYDDRYHGNVPFAVERIAVKRAAARVMVV